MQHRTLPALGEPHTLQLPPMTHRTLDNGVHLYAVERPGVPLVEMRMHLPRADEASDMAATTLLSHTMLSGTENYTDTELAVALQELGAGLNVDVDPDRALLAGNVLAENLDEYLSLVADVLKTARYPDEQVLIERVHVADQIQLALTQPSTVARLAMMRRLFGEHPYGTELPEPEAVTAITSSELQQLHTASILPAGSVVVLVGRAEAQQMLDAAEAALTPWSSTRRPATMRTPDSFEAGELSFVERRDAVQSTLRLAMPAVGRSHEEYAALKLANFIYGGYFSSRLINNLREDKGYTYSAHSWVELNAAASILHVETDVASEVSAAALNEVLYELGRINTVAPTAEEVEDVRQYALGTQLLAIETHAGLASMLTRLIAAGHEPTWLEEYCTRLTKLSVDDVAAAAGKYLVPTAAVSVVVGTSDARNAVARIL